MTQLLIKAVKLTVITNGGKFGCSVSFQKGLNVIRAENTSGKSTLLNSICYAFGLETILGRFGPQALKPAVRSTLEFEKSIYKVLESFVELECGNHRNEVITIKRQIVGQQDDRLIALNRGARLTGGEVKDYIDEFYFVRDPGAAQRERGFHQFLAKFLDLTLPITETYDGADVPLYLECIFPLFFIEQKRGWSNLQATIPTRYRIRNAAKTALEYTLALDAPENEKKKTSIEREKEQVKTRWASLHSSLNFIAREVGGVLNGFPLNPTASLGDADLPYVTIFEDEKWFNLDSWIIKIREAALLLKDQLEAKAEETEDQDQSLKQQLRKLEDTLLFREAAAAEARDEYYEEETNRTLLQNRLRDLDSDLVKNQDTLKLQKYGADLATALAVGQCPTCHQLVVDTLLEQPDAQMPMSLEANIEFLKGQHQAARLLLNHSAKILSSKGLIYRKRLEVVEETRQRIRDIKSNLTKPSSVPNIALLRDLISAEQKLTRAENAREKIEGLLEEVVGLSALWKNVLEREAAVPRDFFSGLDKEKLAKLAQSFRKNVALFGFKTVSPDLIQISPDTYRPTIEGFEIAFDASASDNIRIIWAYTLALQELSDDFDIQHWNVTFFDEPGQQQVHRSSREAFYKEAAHLQNGHQVIATTSERPENLSTFLENVPHNMIEFGTKVLRPVES